MDSADETSVHLTIALNGNQSHIKPSVLHKLERLSRIGAWNRFVATGLLQSIGERVAFGKRRVHHQQMNLRIGTWERSQTSSPKPSVKKPEHCNGHSWQSQGVLGLWWNVSRKERALAQKETFCRIGTSIIGVSPPERLLAERLRYLHPLVETLSPKHSQIRRSQAAWALITESIKQAFLSPIT